MEYGFLEKILGKDFITKLKIEIEKVKFAWEHRSAMTDDQHAEVMALVEGTTKALESIAGRLENIEKAIAGNSKDQP